MSAGWEQQRKPTLGGIHKIQRAKPTQRDVNRAAYWVDAINDKLESRSDTEHPGLVDDPPTTESPPIEPIVAASFVELTQPETREEGADIRFDVTTEDVKLDQSNGWTGGGSRVARGHHGPSPNTTSENWLQARSRTLMGTVPRSLTGKLGRARFCFRQALIQFTN